MSATKRVDDIFFEALEFLDEPSRSRYLDRVCGNDHQLKSSIERLIRNKPRLGDFLESPVTRIALPHALDVVEQLSQCEGQTELRFGPYRHLAKIGEGGMGEVYRAEQESPVQRTVAIKVIRAGMASASCLARFEQERQAISMMNHPNIARLLDAGTAKVAWPSESQDGMQVTECERPYFSMEFVCGNSITQHCDQNQLTIKQRIELLLQVCLAVQHAHQKGIIHRDLKPSNILMDTSDGQSTPKVIDFGIAKAIGQRATFPLETRVGQIIGTLEYMSPEQLDAQANDIDTRSDIYSLGVVLHQLVVGSTPFSSEELQQGGLTGLLHTLGQVEPERPSTKLAKSKELKAIAANRQTAPQRLVAQVSGDLDWIILKCIEKARDSRYETAKGLASDLQRFLANEPVQARPANMSYWLSKKLRKHYFAVATSAAILLLILTTAIVSIDQAIKASRAEARALEGWAQADAQRKNAESVNDFLRDVIGNAKSDAKGASVRLVDTLSDASRSASLRFAEDPVQEAKVRSLLGDVYADLTMLRESTSETKRAKELLQSVLDENDRRVLAAEVQYVRALINEASTREAAAALKGLLPRVQQAFGEDDPIAFDAERLTLSNLRSQGKYSECIEGLRLLRQRAEQVGMEDATLVTIFMSLVTALRTQLGAGNRVVQLECVTEIERLAVEWVQRASRWKGPDSPQAIRARVIVAEMNVYQGSYELAATNCVQVLESSVDRLGQAHQQRIAALNVLSRAKNRLGRKREAAELQLQRIELARIGNPNPISLIAKLSDALPFLDSGGYWEKGEHIAREYANELSYASGHDDLLLVARAYVARFVSLQGRIDEANLLFNELASEIAEEVGVNHSIAKVHLFFAQHQRQYGTPELAEKHLKLAESALSDIRVGTCLANPDDVIQEFIHLYEQQNRLDQKAKYEALLPEVQYSLADLQ
ncbi:MAG: serine/threonine-protein kinase [Pirellulaceae bacterium]|nr:serine/threonine-protein kinase [Pirellulaceae bacterium]